jgi:hypothetical protein
VNNWGELSKWEFELCRSGADASEAIARHSPERVVTS